MEETEGWIEITINTPHNMTIVYEFIEYDSYDLEEMNIGESTSHVCSDLEDLIVDKGKKDGILYDEYQSFNYTVKMIEYPPEDYLNNMIRYAKHRMEREKNELEWLEIQLMLARKNAKESEW